MKVLLLDSVHVAMDFFPFVHDRLTDAIANLRVDSHTMANDYGMPGFVAHSEGYDAVLVFLTHTKDNVSVQRLNTVVSKLIDVEIDKGFNIYTVILDVTGESFEGEAKEALGKDVAEYCYNLLLNPSAIQEGKGKPPEEHSAPVSGSEATEGSPGSFVGSLFE